MTNMIKVTNGNDFTIIDHFEGLAYIFAPGKAVNVPIEVMHHIFGIEFPADEALMKTPAFRDQLFNSVAKRWGWNSHDEEKIKRFRNQCDLIAFHDLDVVRRDEPGRAEHELVHAQAFLVDFIGRGEHRDKQLPDGGSTGFTMDENHIRGFWKHYSGVMNAGA